MWVGKGILLIDWAVSCGRGVFLTGIGLLCLCFWISVRVGVFGISSAWCLSLVPRARFFAMAFGYILRFFLFARV